MARFLAELDALRNDHGLIGQLFWRGAFWRAGVFQAHFDLAQPQDLPGLQRGFAGDLMAIDEGAVGGIEIVNDDVAAAQQNFAVMAGNGAFRDGKRIIIDPADGGFVHRQFVSFARQPFAENN